MGVTIIYLALLLYMMYALFLSGKAIKKNSVFWSRAVIWGIIVYSLNEGLRFGRGIDYNLYGQRYESLLAGNDFGYEIGFSTVANILATIGVPWQGFVIIISLIFILSVTLFIKHFKDVAPYALPLFVLFSLSRSENMIRWYMGFSFILIGLYYLLKNERRSLLKYCILCVISCGFHFALAPVGIAFYLVFLRKKIFIPPFVTIVLFYCIAFFFQTSFMLQVADTLNVFSMYLGDYSHYVDNADYWFTGGFAGAERNALPGITAQLLLVVLTIWGYKSVQKLKGVYVYAYNMFLIGYLTTPIGRQIELISRYNAVFYFFGGIVFACILFCVFKKKLITLQPIAYIFVFVVFLNYGRFIIYEPIKGNKDHYLYVWDRNGRTYDDLYETWIDGLKYNN